MTKEEHYRKVLAMIGSIDHSYQYMGLYTAEEALKAIHETLTVGYKEYEKTQL